MQADVLPAPAAAGSAEDDAAACAAMLDLLERLLTAAGDEQFGERVLEAVWELLRRPARALYVFDPPDGRARCVAAVNVSQLFLERYERDGRRRDPILAQALASGRVATSSEVVDAADRRDPQGPLVLARMHRLESVMIAPVSVEGRIVATINLADYVERPASGEDVRSLELIARATGIALAQRARTARLQARADRLSAAFDRAPVGLAITTPQEERPIMNAAAKELMRDVADPERALYDVLARSGASGSASGVIQAQLKRGGRAELIGVSHRLEGEPGASVTVLEGTGHAHSAAALALLTPREREVVLLVAEGLTDVEVAARLDVSPHTVSQHLKRAYQKLGVHSRVAVARLVMMGSPPRGVTSRVSGMP